MVVVYFFEVIFVVDCVKFFVGIFSVMSVMFMFEVFYINVFLKMDFVKG